MFDPFAPHMGERDLGSIRPDDSLLWKTRLNHQRNGSGMTEQKDETFAEQVPHDKQVSLVKRVMAAGADAPKVIIEAAIDANGAWAAQYKRTRSGTSESQADLVARVIKSHVRLARSEGAALAAALTAAEVGSVVGTAGTLTAPAAVTGIVTDLTGLAWIQTRMVLTIAALEGHDPQSGTRYKELASLMGIYGAPQTEAAAAAVGKSTGKAATRLVLRHLKGQNLVTVKALFRAVGFNFTRVGLVKVIPFVNVPISAVLNGGATSALGKKAAAFYRDLPTPDEMTHHINPSGAVD